MRKLKLDLDALAVETFETTQPDESQGTIFGNQHGGAITGLSCFQVTCNISCFASCHATCLQTCGQTCPLRPSCGPTCHVTCFATCHGSCFATCQFTCFASCHHTCPQLCLVASGHVACGGFDTPQTINQG